MTDTTAFVDTSTECAICLEALESAPTITLSCGHRWHLACLREQLQNAQPSRSKRLIFSGCRCAKCNAFCDHPKLENLTRRTDALRKKVDGLVAEQLKVDAPDAWKTTFNDAAAKVRLVDRGRHSYAFYLCAGCDEPYFGGTVECADEGEEGELVNSEDRLCRSCSPKSQMICQHAFEHRPFHVWKCRYCCNPSSFVCYGNVHFCNSCHDRNSRRARDRSRGLDPPALEGIPCRGGASCPFPKPDGRNHHSNGPNLDCEQVYYCASCESRPSGNVFEEASGSRNFITNPSGENGTEGWRAFAHAHSHHSNNMWMVEDISIPVDERTRTNFVSSFRWCIMSQTISLNQYSRDPSMARLEISAKFMGRTDCPSIFRMEAVVTNRRGEELRRVSTGYLDAPADTWERATLIIDPLHGAQEVTMTLCGKDRLFWAGNYGSKVCHCSVRILGTEDELRDIILPEQNHVQVQHRQHHQNYAYLRKNALDILLPVVLIIFFWMISE